MRARNSARERAASAAEPVGLVSRAVDYALLLVARARLCLRRALSTVARR